MSGGRRWCQGCKRRRPEGSVRLGRGGPENVTSGARRAAKAGPIPLTCWSPSNEPKGPAVSRSATIRAASAGPMPGSRSSSAAAARSTSMGPRGAGGGAPCPGGAVGARGLAPLATAESTAAIWRASASRSLAGATAWRTARPPRTARPSAATAATKSSARRSAGVGTPQASAGAQAPRHRSNAFRFRFPESPQWRRRPRAAASAATPCPRCPRGCGARDSRGRSRRSPVARPR